MNKQEKELIKHLIYEAYHFTIPRLLEIGKDDFIINNLNIFFKYDKNKMSELLDATIHPYNDEEGTMLICGIFYSESNSIDMRLEAICRIAISNVEFYASNNRKVSIEKAARTCMIPILAHELFHYNQYVDYTIKDSIKRLEKEEYMVYQKSIEFILKHLCDLTYYLDCDMETLIDFEIEKGEEHSLEELGENAALIAKNNIVKMFPKVTYTEYEYTNSCNFIARYIYNTYQHRKNHSEAYNDKILTSEEEIYQYVRKFIDDYENARSVKMEFDVSINKFYLGNDIYEKINEPRCSGYVLLKENHKDLNELKSIERLFIEIMKKIDKAAGINKKQLLKLDNVSLYERVMAIKNGPGDYLMISTIMEYSMHGDEMIIYLKNLNTK